MEEKNMGTYEFEMKEYDYTKSKNEREAGNLARADAVAELLPFLKARFGDEQAEMIAKDTIGFRIGPVIDKDGCPVDIVIAIKPTVKQYQEHCGEKKCSKGFDFDQAVDNMKKNLDCEE